MRKLIIILTIVSICTLLFADSTRKTKKYGLTGLPEYKAKTPRELIDSLEAELANAQEDTNKVKLLVNIAERKSYITGDDPIPRGLEAIELSKKLNWKKGEGIANRTLGYIYLNQNNQLEKSIFYSERAYEIGKEVGSKYTQGVALTNIAAVYVKHNKLDLGEKYALEALQIAKDLQNQNFIASLCNTLGSVCYYKKKYKEAIKYFEDAILAVQSTKNVKTHCALLGNLGNITKELGDTSKAMEYYKKAVEVAENSLDSASISLNLGSICDIYKKSNQIGKAIPIMERMIEIDKSIRNYNSLIANYQNIGTFYLMESNYILAYQALEQAIEFSKGNNNYALSHIYNSLGVLDLKMGNTDKAIQKYLKAYDLLKESKEQNNDIESFKSIYLLNIAGCYMEKNNEKDYKTANDYAINALEIAEKIENNNVIVTSNSVIAAINIQSKNYDKAKLNLDYALTKKDKVDDRIALTSLYSELSSYYLKISQNTNLNLETIKSNLKLANLFNDTATIYNDEKIKLTELYIQKSEILEALGNHKEALEHFKKAQELKDSIFSTESKVKIANLEAQRELEVKNKELALKAKENELLQANNTNQTLALEKQRQQVALLNSQQSLQRMELEKRQNQLSLLQKDKTLAELNIRNKEAEAKSNAQEIKLLQINQKNQENEIKTKNYQLYLSIFGIMSVLFVAFIVYRERKKSEELLLNILPATIAKRLKAKEQPIADHFDSASVMFIDIVGFTQMSANEDPKRIVVALNEVFTKFDKLADKHGLEKIKTIGDSYMVAAGIPIAQPDHALRACNMAMDIKREMQDYTIGKSKIEFRIGIDCGAVVAGVIGEKKFIYDLWSDAVNTASRMESTGVAGEIHITDNFKQELEKLSNNYKFQARETIEVKGKGQMQTWFVG